MAKSKIKKRDPLCHEQRSRQMALVRAKNTKPEMRVRHAAHALGFRYRLHRKDIPGCPDLVFPSKCKIIFVHGCFWHRHKGCSRCRLPKSRLNFWKSKLVTNVERDKKVKKKLQRLGWNILVIWECQTLHEKELKTTLRRFLEG